MTICFPKFAFKFISCYNLSINKKALGPFKKGLKMGKIIQFFIESKAELQKVVWPSRKDTVKYTAVVIGFSLAITVVLAATDIGLTKLLEKVFTK